MKVVDAHVHLMDLSTGLYPGFETPSTSFIGNTAPICRSFCLSDLLSEAGSEIEIAKIVNVEALPTDRLAESRFLQDVADTTVFPIAIVAGADLSMSDAQQQLEAQTAFANLRGIRQILNQHPDASYNYMSRDYMADETWRRNFRLLEKFGLSFDMQLYPHQFEQAFEVIAENPTVQFVINHAGMYADRTLNGWRIWRDGMRRFAGFENVAVKISGLGMLDHRWTVESFRPYVFETLDAFGTTRALFASNFPVDRLFGTYIDTWSAFAAITADFSNDEKTALFSANAERIYRF